MVNTGQKERRQPQTKRRPVSFVGRSRLRPVLAIIVLSSIATIGCRDKGGSTSGGNGPKDTPDVTAPTTSDFAKAIRLRNRGLGHLENQEWADAESTLSELVATSPDTLLPRRNLAISRVLMVTSAGFKRSGGAEEEKNTTTLLPQQPKLSQNSGQLSETIRKKKELPSTWRWPIF